MYKLRTNNKVTENITPEAKTKDDFKYFVKSN